MLAFEALGIVETIDRRRRRGRASHEVVPAPTRAAAATYAELLPVFAGLYDALAPSFRLLGGLRSRAG